MRAVLMSVVFAAVGAAVGAPCAAAAPATPSAGELTSKLQRMIDTSLSDQERAGELQGGLAAIPTADNIAGQMNRYASFFSWSVQNPSVAGDQLNSDLTVTMPLFGTRSHPIVWVNDSGDWKLTNASACVIATQVANTVCTL